MAKLIRCRPCGYVGTQAETGQPCPACGAAATAFEPYEDKVSARRRFILDLDLHPILVHAPQAFATLLPLLAAVGICLPAFYETELAAVVIFHALILPPSVVGAIISGLIDGRTKMKRLKARFLVRKIILGLCLLAISGAGAAVVALGGFQQGTKLPVLVLGVASFGCAVLLGRTGKRLIIPILPGR